MAAVPRYDEFRADLQHPDYIVLPEGVTKAEAGERIRPWVPLPNGPTEAHEGARLRVVWDNGRARIEDRVRRVRDGMAEWAGGAGDNWNAFSGDWFIHPDDVPDPDAELVERIEAVLRERQRLGHIPRWTDEHGWHDHAVEILAVVRGCEGTA